MIDTEKTDYQGIQNRTNPGDGSVIHIAIDFSATKYNNSLQNPSRISELVKRIFRRLTFVMKRN